MEQLKKTEWQVRPISIGVARRFVERYHYAAGAANTATYLHGLFRTEAFFEEECRGIAWWIPPTKQAGQSVWRDPQAVLCLSRFVIEPDVPKNAASFLLAGSRKQICSTRWPCLLTYASEFAGHLGTIYRADNWEYLGRTRPERLYIRNGRLVARKAGPRTKTHSEMLQTGAVYAGAFIKHKFRKVR